MATKARTKPGCSQARSFIPGPGVSGGFQGPKHRGHLPQLFTGHEQGGGSEVRHQGRVPATSWDSSITGGDYILLHLSTGPNTRF